MPTSSKGFLALRRDMHLYIARFRVMVQREFYTLGPRPLKLLGRFSLTELIVVDTVTLRHRGALQPSHRVEDGHKHHSYEYHEPHYAQHVRQEHKL